MQRLYENHKVLTYPRTDSRYLSSDIVPSIKERLEACGVGPYRKLAGRLMNQKIVAKPSFVDDKKVSDHHAIIPTEQFVQLDHMTVEERKIYDLVVRRFIAVLYPPFEYEQTELTVELAGENFAAKGRIVKSAGWREVYEGQDDDEDDGEDSERQEIRAQKLPDVKRGDRIPKLSVTMTEGKTKPPAPFNEATLLSAMENPTAYMESKDKACLLYTSKTGMDSRSFSLRSISKHLGAEMSSRLMPPKVGATHSTVRMISSTSFVARQRGNALTPANSRNRMHVPSMTGMAASGPISPSPSTAVPSVTTATKFPRPVSS